MPYTKEGNKLIATNFCDMKSEKEVAIIVETLSDQKDQKQAVTHLAIYRYTALTPAIRAPIFASLATLTIFGLRNGFSDQQARELSHRLQGNTVLTSLNLAANDIGNNGLQAISLILPTLTSLQILELHGNLFTAHGVKFLAEQIRKNPVLTHLDLSNNQVGFGVRYLVEAAKQLPALFLSEARIDERMRKHVAKIITNMLPFGFLDIYGNKIKIELLVNNLEKNFWRAILPPIAVAFRRTNNAATLRDPVLRHSIIDLIKDKNFKELFGFLNANAHAFQQKKLKFACLMEEEKHIAKCHDVVRDHIVACCDPVEQGKQSHAALELRQHTAARDLTDAEYRVEVRRLAVQYTKNAKINAAKFLHGQSPLERMFAAPYDPDSVQLTELADDDQVIEVVHKPTAKANVNANASADAKSEISAADTTAIITDAKSTVTMNNLRSADVIRREYYTALKLSGSPLHKTAIVPSVSQANSQANSLTAPSSNPTANISNTSLQSSPTPARL